MLFMIRPIGSKPGIGEYDPWNDLNSDGTVDIYDAINLAGTYGTSGDPTKNVTIAGHANKLVYSVEEQPVPAGGYFLSPSISVDGYSKMTVSIYEYNPPTSFNRYQLAARHFNSSNFFGVDTQFNITLGLVKTYDVPNQEIVVGLFNYDTKQSYVWIDVYVIP
jgi:hypothetical protein